MTFEKAHDTRYSIGVADHKTAVLMLQKLRVKGWLIPVLRGNENRVVRYELAHVVLNYLDFE